ncbi:deoxynucleoside kinase [Mycoplasma nasistruthionis]|uniref:Deoxynucleoside kinase n=1 Tax=Mycoplasma nasistruthionis TaxID=353852 RepID=A0A4Y6I6R8_9MOLU|nr:deoxynucleoside kinase [Mycoplasma nasistruthionis]QCZ36803.1 deoxynucleoside kinase [Mycoplasma nasistruthionis]QDF65082.1 deoxynucleoside kinase [Mycoplasma nasistruthionis]
MLIGISGMISSGKSTLSKKLIEHYEGHSLLIDEFTQNDEVFNTMLKWFYEKKPNLELSFQTYVVEHHMENVRKHLDKFDQMGLDSKNDFLFLDRFGAEHYVFAMVNFKNLPEKTMKAYDALFNELITPSELPEFAIFLDVSYENFKNRLFKRGRDVEIENYEKNETYFKELYDVYKDTYIKVVEKYKINYAILDTNDLTEDQVLEEAVKLIEAYKASK